MDHTALTALTRAQLQTVAKIHGVKANGKSAVIVQSLTDAFPDGVPPAPVAEEDAPSRDTGKAKEFEASPRPSAPNKESTKGARSTRKGASSRVSVQKACVTAPALEKPVEEEEDINPSNVTIEELQAELNESRGREMELARTMERMRKAMASPPPSQYNETMPSSSTTFPPPPRTFRVIEEPPTLLAPTSLATQDTVAFFGEDNSDDEAEVAEMTVESRSPSPSEEEFEYTVKDINNMQAMLDSTDERSPDLTQQIEETDILLSAFNAEAPGIGAEISKIAKTRIIVERDYLAKLKEDHTLWNGAHLLSKEDHEKAVGWEKWDKLADHEDLRLAQAGEPRWLEQSKKRSATAAGLDTAQSTNEASSSKRQRLLVPLPTMKNKGKGKELHIDSFTEGYWARA